jgi:hypothetical protein
VADDVFDLHGLLAVRSCRTMARKTDADARAIHRLDPRTQNLRQDARDVQIFDRRAGALAAAGAATAAAGLAARLAPWLAHKLLEGRS